MPDTRPGVNSEANSPSPLKRTESEKVVHLTRFNGFWLSAMKLISWWGCGKTDQTLIFRDKIVELGIAHALSAARAGRTLARTTIALILS
jgi:hypothetical protein